MSTPTSPLPAISSGQTIKDHYQIDSLIASGGMSDVYLARDIRLGRQVAIKCVRKDRNSPILQKRLQQESRLLAQLNHPNIVQIYDVIEYGDQLMLVMEYVSGENLTQWLTVCRPDLHKRLQVAKDVILALAFFHRASIIHRDLKPENILINRSGQVKIIDFGIGKQPTSSSTCHTQDGAFLGSFVSASPEQIQGHSPNKQSDYFSYGLLLFYLLTKRHPFGDTYDVFKIAHHVLNGAPIDVRDVLNDCPENMARLLTSLLEKNPQQRENDAQRIIIVLEAYIDQLELSADTQDLSVEDNTVTSTNKHLLDKFKFTTPSIDNTEDNKRHNKTRRLISYAAAGTALCLFIFITITSSLPDAPIATKILLAPTDIEYKNNERYLQNFDISSTVEHTLKNTIIHHSGHYLIHEQAIQKNNNDIVKHATVTDSNIVIQPKISCINQKCQITLTKLVSPHWNIQGVYQQAVIPERHLAVRRVVQRMVEQLLAIDETNNKTLAPLDEKIYLEYLALSKILKNHPNRYQEVLDNLNHLITKAPKFFPLYVLFGEAAQYAFDVSNNSTVLESWEKHLINVSYLIPESEALYTQFFLAYKYLNHEEKAQEFLFKLQGIKIPNSVLHRYEGELAQMQGEYKLAERKYKQAIKLSPSALLHRKLVTVLWMQGKNEQAKLALQQLFKLLPNDRYGLTHQAQIHLLEGDLDTSEAAYLALINIEPDAYSMSNLGLVYLLKRQYLQARQVFTQALDYSKDPSDRINLADTELLLGNTSVAMHLYQEILVTTKEANHDDIDIQLTRTQAFAQLGRHSESLRIIHDLIQKSPKDPNVIFTAALVFTLAGEYQSATLYAQDAIQSGVGEIWFALPWFDKLCAFTEHTTAARRPYCHHKHETAQAFDETIPMFE